MKIEYFAVRNKLLEKYIDFYYTLSTISDAENTTYLAFPSSRSPIAFIKNGTLINKPGRPIFFINDQRWTVTLAGNFLKPLQITFEPNIIEFSVLFKPAGINFFVQQRLEKAMCETIAKTDYFNEFLPTAEKIIDGVDAINEFENKLISRFASNKQLELLQSIIAKFQDSENAFTDKQISTELNISPKQYFRLFKNNLGVNPTQYRNLLRFRNALNLSLGQFEELNFAQVGLFAGYYDQPHFNREFRKFTNRSPKEFFGKVSFEANNKIIWQFLSKMSESYNQ